MVDKKQEDINKQLQGYLTNFKVLQKNAMDALSKIPNLSVKQKKQVVIDGADVDVSVTETGVIFLEFKDKVKAEKYYKKFKG